jgi:lipoate-protein ligase A
MIKLNSPSLDPSFNLAVEEYFLKNNSEDIFFTYTDSPSIICGKHQNALGEVNFEQLNDLQLPLFRRLSGGGTVYHDQGNLNFCFITNGPGHNMIDFKGFTNHIVKALNELGVEAYYGGRNDLLINGNKISGNACHVFKKRAMHHGTLLYSSNLGKLGNALKTDPTKYRDKAVKSVRSVVTNIADHLSSPLPFDDFKTYLFNTIWPDAEEITLSADDIVQIETLAKEKYATWEWSYGYSPEYTFKKRFAVAELAVQVQIEIIVHKGVIQSISTIASKNKEEMILAFSKLVGQQHRFETIMDWVAEELSVVPTEKRKALAMQLF